MAETQAADKPKIVTLPVLEYFFASIKDRFVLKETGKGLSANDFSDELKQKLENLSAEGYNVATQEDIDAMLNGAFNGANGTAEAGSGEGSSSGGGASLDGDGEVDDEF